jgi:hypothetical protein
MSWERFNDQFRETDGERQERWKAIRAKRKSEGKCWQCAKLIAECSCPNVKHACKLPSHHQQGEIAPEHPFNPTHWMPLPDAQSQPATYPDLREECANLDYLNKSYQERIALLEGQVEQLRTAMAYAVNLAQYVGEAKEQSILRAEATLFLKEYGSLAIPSTDGGAA